MSITSSYELSDIYPINQVVGTETFSTFKPSDMRFEKIGYGSEYVYVVYSKAMRLEAILKSKDNWPLKVGKTNNLQRRIVQLSESERVFPTVYFAFMFARCFGGLVYACLTRWH